ncbi:sugar phosphate isomerase/epimerase family protein [Terrimonas sp.]|uniref:sugar phosphate isomerase/epimerase family protein n=1 Tax=Terrimonas sp. TaxID=1914338 RepID=UPI000E3281B2|nr:hypothetical protein [Terrimonas sp.]
MKLKILCPKWGFEEMDIEPFLVKIKEAGYDGIDTWVPDHPKERQRWTRLLEEYELIMVSQQYQASGTNIESFCKSFEYFLYSATETNPILINSHTGRDFFTLDEQLMLLDTASAFSAKNNIEVVHETHRGSIGYSPANAQVLFDLRETMKITADFSHWVCVTESYLDGYKAVLNEAVERAAHIHARVGFPQGPQIPDPRNNIWVDAVQTFLQWWIRIVNNAKERKEKQITITPEFGPPPYMWTSIEDNKPIVSQWEINLFMKEILRKNIDENILLA